MRLTPVTQRRGRRWSAADAYLRPALQRRNLTLRTEACATRVVFEGTTAVGVEIEQGGRTEVLRAGEVLLAAGAVASPALLLRSGIGAAGELAALGIRPVCDLEGVGRNLQDHLVAGLLVESRRPITLAAAERPRSLARYLLTRRGPLSSNVAEAAAFVHSRPGLAAPDLELVFCPVLYVGEGLVPPPGHGFTIGVTGLQPQSVGSVRLRSADPGSPPQINPAYLTDPTGADLAVLGEGFELARRIAAAPAFAQLAGGELAPGELSVEQHVRATAHTMYHPVGTCRMGSDEQSVVDSRLRVHGVEGLRVVDASVMPRIPRGHTNLPTMMVAERAAELLQERGGAARSSRSAQHARAR